MKTTAEHNALARSIFYSNGLDKSAEEIPRFQFALFTSFLSPTDRRKNLAVSVTRFQPGPQTSGLEQKSFEWQDDLGVQENCILAAMKYAANYIAQQPRSEQTQMAVTPSYCHAYKHGFLVCWTF